MKEKINEIVNLLEQVRINCDPYHCDKCGLCENEYTP